MHTFSSLSEYFDGDFLGHTLPTSETCNHAYASLRFFCLLTTSPDEDRVSERDIGFGSDGYFSFHSSSRHMSC